MTIGKKSVYSPITQIKNIFKKPVTVRYPKEHLNVFPVEGVSPRYRGMHANDLEKCIGCGSCKRICPIDAIEMKLPQGKEDIKKNYRPVIDYGRCCFCAFCVDMCPTSSINMSRNYLYEIKTPLNLKSGDEINFVKDKFVIKPDEKYGDNFGYKSGKKEKVLG